MSFCSFLLAPCVIPIFTAVSPCFTDIMDSQSIARFTKLVGRWVFSKKWWVSGDSIAMRSKVAWKFVHNSWTVGDDAEVMWYCWWNSGSFRCCHRFVEASRIDWSNLSKFAPAPLERSQGSIKYLYVTNSRKASATPANLLFYSSMWWWIVQKATLFRDTDCEHLQK